MDFSRGKPLGAIKTAEMAESKPVELTSDWVWSTVGDPKVMELCSSGLDVVRAIIASRDSMNFPE
jgi:hypothetical protein